MLFTYSQITHYNVIFYILCPESSYYVHKCFSPLLPHRHISLVSHLPPQAVNKYKVYIFCATFGYTLGDNGSVVVEIMI